MTLDSFFTMYFVDSMPCSFDYDGKNTADLFSPIERDMTRDGRNYQAYRREMRIAGENRVFSAVMRIRKFQTAVEWWLELTQDGVYDSAIVDSIHYADLALYCTKQFHPSAWRYPLFHWSHGSLAQEDDFQPVRQNFIPEPRHVLRCTGGRSSQACLPYFNIQLQDDMGVIFAIGWNGQWQSTLERVDNGFRGVRLTCEMDNPRFRVQPGEKLVLPKVTALPWEGDVRDSFNTFRRFMKNDILPRYDGRPLKGYVTLRSWGGFTPEIHRSKFRNIRERRLGAELYQIDAGWNGDETTPKSEQYYFDIWHKTVGIWKPLPALYPNGLSRMSRDCLEAGMGFAVWFEPERMPSWNDMVKKHREYFIGAKLPGGSKNDEPFYLMLNLGDENARQWIVDTLSKVIEDADMEVFRIDFNYEPLPFWRYNDAPDRQGITEIKYVNGVYAMLDELLARHPKLKIDNCASGGRRLDYRMFRRSMPMLCRSDYFCGQDNEPAPKQAHTYGLSLWIPAHADSLGSCIGHTPEKLDTYRARSTMCSGIGMTAPWWDMTDEEGAWYRRTLSEARLVREYASEDFYPLTGCTLDERDWMAFQYNNPDTQSGIVMAFRREESETPCMAFALRGIDETAVYRLTDADNGALGEMRGAELKVLRVEINEKRSSRIIQYEKA